SLAASSRVYVMSTLSCDAWRRDAMRHLRAQAGFVVRQQDINSGESPLALRTLDTHAGAVLIVRIYEHYSRGFEGPAPLLHRSHLRIAAPQFEFPDGLG